MKKLYTLLIILSVFISGSAFAQLSCNPQFTVQFLSANNVKFNPVINTDSPFVQHYWTFGTGNASSNAISPVHFYLSNFTYSVKHKIVISIPGSNFNCSDSTTQLVTVSQSTCTLIASFNAATSATNNFTHSYQNTSFNFSPGDSIRWNFGDGTTSNLNNPTHTFTAPGLYNICLWVKKPSTSPSTIPCVSEYCRLDTVAPATSCNLSANFIYSVDSLATIPNSYHFTNTSVGYASTDSIKWNFGDGTSSNQNNPTHNYLQPGSYNVCVRIIKRTANGALTNCISESCSVINIVAQNTCNIQAYFSNTTDSLQQNLIHFFNQSVNIIPTDSIRWVFGDGTTSTVLSPNHVFANAGIYNVCLIITRHTAAGTILCIREYCKQVTINNACNVVANFSWYRDTLATANYTYQFTNTSTNFSSTDSVKYTFGDGTSSNQINPSHVYAQPGNYVVCLRIIKRNVNGTLSNCVSEKCYTISITTPCNIQPNFTWVASSTNYKTINFTNTTIAPLTGTSILWNFGDGTTATNFNTTHNYAQAGTYFVCLRLQYGNCVTFKCDSVRVIAPLPTCNQQANYSFVRSTTNNNIITFTPDFIAANVAYTWTFGDGTGAQTANATHQYNATGYYTVCLTAFRNNSCAVTVCKTVYVSSITNCALISLGINHVPDSLVPNRITFYPTTGTTVTNQSWTITKLPTTATSGTATINANNPTYVFLDSGYYRICLRATFAGGCVKEFCKIIYVAQNMPFVTSCSLQVFPNPATNVANASVTLAQPTILYAYIYNSMNMLVAQKQQQGFVGSNTVSVNIGNLPAGVYNYRMVYNNQFCSASFIK